MKSLSETPESRHFVRRTVKQGTNSRNRSFYHHNGSIQSSILRVTSVNIAHCTAPKTFCFNLYFTKGTMDDVQTVHNSQYINTFHRISQNFMSALQHNCIKQTGSSVSASNGFFFNETCHCLALPSSAGNHPRRCTDYCSAISCIPLTLYDKAHTKNCHLHCSLMLTHNYQHHARSGHPPA
jgi:hypothetical protein